MLKLFAGAASLAVLCLSSPAMAQTGMTSVIPNFNFQFIEPALTSAGVSYTRQTNGNLSYLVINVNGVEMLVAPAACSQETATCVGLEIATIRDGSISLEDINRLNLRMRTVKVVSNEAGKWMVYRYLIGDHGYTRGSLLANLQVFVSSTNQVIGLVSGATGASYAPEQAGPIIVAPGVAHPSDTLDDDLNAQQLEGLRRDASMTEAAPLRMRLAPTIADGDAPSLLDLLSNVQ